MSTCGVHTRWGEERRGWFRRGWSCVRGYVTGVFCNLYRLFSLSLSLPPYLLLTVSFVQIIVMIHANALWMLYTLGKALLSAGIFLRLKRGYERLYYSDYGNCGDRDIKDSDFWRITLINTYTSFHVSCKSISIRDSACLSFVTIFSRWNTRLSWKRDDENPYRNGGKKDGQRGGLLISVAVISEIGGLTAWAVTTLPPNSDSPTL